MRLAFLFLILSSFPALAQDYLSATPPASFHNDPHIIRRDSLTDCYTFERDAWNTANKSIERTALWLCQEILRAKSRGQQDDETKALETLLLDYEGDVRAWAISSLFYGNIPDGLYNGPPLIEASDWTGKHMIREDIRQENGIVPILEFYTNR